MQIINDLSVKSNKEKKYIVKAKHNKVSEAVHNNAKKHRRHKKKSQKIESSGNGEYWES